MKDNMYPYDEIGELEKLLYSFQPLPGKSFYARMARGPWVQAAKPVQKRGTLSRRLALAAILGALLLATLGFTPVGRVLAQEIIHFFSRAPGDTIPLSPEQIQSAVPSVTPQSTYFPALLPVTQVAATAVEPTSQPTPVLPSEQKQNLDSMSAKALVDFDLLQPDSLPKDYRLQNIIYDPDQQAVIMQYSSPKAGTGEFFSLSQGRKLAEPEIGANAVVETLDVADKEVEMVRGGWITLNGASTSTWEKDMETYTWRWEENDIAFSLGFSLNETFSPAYLKRDEMLDVIKSLSRCQSQDYLCEVSQAAAAAGFIPWQFSQVPQEYEFKNVDYRPGMTAIWYGSSRGELGVLQSRDNFANSDQVSDWFSVPEEAIQIVNVGGQVGEYVNGSFMTKAGEDHATWSPDSDQIRLRWKAGEWWFQMVKWGEPVLEPQQLADLAASLAQTNEVLRARPQNSNDSSRENQAYLSIKEAEEIYGQHVLEPTLLPDGLPFSHVRILGDNILQLYGSFEADKMHANGSLLAISQGNGRLVFEDSYQGYPSEAIESVTVNGAPAKLVSGTLLTSFDASGNQSGPEWKSEPFMLTLIWQEEDLVFSVQFSAGGESGARISKEDLIAIAESLN